MRWRPSERFIMRLLAAAVPAAAIGVPFLFPIPAKLPSAALGSAGFLHVEESFGVFLALSALVVFSWRAWKGDLPNKTSHSGTEYKEAIGTASDRVIAQTDALQVQVDRLLGRVERAELAQRELRQLSAQLEALRDSLNTLAEEVEAIADFVTS